MPKVQIIVIRGDAPIALDIPEHIPNSNGKYVIFAHSSANTPSLQLAVNGEPVQSVLLLAAGESKNIEIPAKEGDTNKFNILTANISFLAISFESIL